MGILRKRGPDTLDYTLLQKKGFIKKPAEKKMPFKIDQKGMVDFTSSNQDVFSGNFANSETNAEKPSPFNFLDDLARSSINSSAGNDFSTSNSALSLNSVEMNALKIKIDDLEYKLSQLIEKLSLIESKMNGFEDKVFN